MPIQSFAAQFRKALLRSVLHSAIALGGGAIVLGVIAAFTQQPFVTFFRLLAWAGIALFVFSVATMLISFRRARAVEPPVLVVSLVTSCIVAFVSLFLLRSPPDAMVALPALAAGGILGAGWGTTNLLFVEGERTTMRGTLWSLAVWGFTLAINQAFGALTGAAPQAADVLALLGTGTAVGNTVCILVRARVARQFVAGRLMQRASAVTTALIAIVVAATVLTAIVGGPSETQAGPSDAWMRQIEALGPNNRDGGGCDPATAQDDKLFRCIVRTEGNYAWWKIWIERHGSIAAADAHIAQLRIRYDAEAGHPPLPIPGVDAGGYYAHRNENNKITNVQLRRHVFRVGDFSVNLREDTEKGHDFPAPTLRTEIVAILRAASVPAETSSSPGGQWSDSKATTVESPVPSSGLAQESLTAAAAAASAVLSGVLAGIGATLVSTFAAASAAASGGPLGGALQSHDLSGGYDEWKRAVEAAGNRVVRQGNVAWVEPGGAALPGVEPVDPELERERRERATYEAEQRRRDDEFNAEQRRKMSSGDTAQDRAIRDLQEKQRVQAAALDKLQKIEKDVYFGSREAQSLWRPRGEPGSIVDKIEKVVEGISSRGEYNPADYERVRKVWGDARSGAIVPESEIPSDASVFADTARGALEGSMKEIVGGVGPDGKLSLTSMGLRTILGAVTGGASELVYTPAQSLQTMKDYVDKDGDSVIGGFTHAIADVVIGEAFGRAAEGLATVGGAAIRAIAHEMPVVTRPVGTMMTEAMERARAAATGAVEDVLEKAGLKNAGRAAQGEAVTSAESIMVKESRQLDPVRKSPDELLERITKRRESGSPHPGLENPSFEPHPDSAGKVRPAEDGSRMGYSHKDQKAIEKVCEDHGVKAYMRPTNRPKDAEKLAGWANGTNPKPSTVKQKTINQDDLLLGFSKDHEGLAAVRKPTPVDSESMEFGSLTAEQQRKTIERFEKRASEFDSFRGKLDQLEKKGLYDPSTGMVKSPDGKPLYRWDQKTGVIYDGANGKPFAGDNDAFVFVDASTGKPVSPFTNQQIGADLERHGAIIHPEHAGWRVPADAEKIKIDSDTLKDHLPGGKPLLAFDPAARKGGGDGWTAEHYTGPTARSSYAPVAQH